MDNVPSASKSKWRSAFDSDLVSRGFNLANSVPIVPTHVSAATMPVPVSAAPNMGFRSPVEMAFAKSARKALSVALTSARTSPPTPRPMQKLHLSVRIHVILSATHPYLGKCRQPGTASLSGKPQTELRRTTVVASHPRQFQPCLTTRHPRRAFIPIFILRRRVLYRLRMRANLPQKGPTARTTPIPWYHTIR